MEAGLGELVAERLAVASTEVTVTCPPDIEVDAGAELVCDVAVGRRAGVAVPLVIGPDDEVTLGSAVVPAAAAADYLAGELAGPAEGPVEVACGTDPLLVVAVDATFACTATRADGDAFTVTVTVEALDGTVSYRVTPT